MNDLASSGRNRNHTVAKTDHGDAVFGARRQVDRVKQEDFPFHEDLSRSTPSVGVPSSTVGGGWLACDTATTTLALLDTPIMGLSSRGKGV